MDSITQAVLGGVVGEVVLGRKIGAKGMAWGLLFGTIPDLDMLLNPWLTEVERLRWHRGVSHSLVMMVVAALVFAKPLAWIHRKRGLSARRAAWFVFWAWSTHVLIDVFTNYGTQIFEPFSDHRVAWSNLFIIDLFFTLPMLTWVIYRVALGLINFVKLLIWLALGQEESERPQSGEISLRGAWIAISLSAFYVVFSLVMKLSAWRQIEERMISEIPHGKLVAVTPTALNTILWRGLIETEDGYFITYYSPFDEEPAEYHYLEKNHELAAQFEGHKAFEDLKWFARNHWIAREGDNGEIVFIDVRLGEVRDYDNQVLVPVFRWKLTNDQYANLSATRGSRKVKMNKALPGLWRRLSGNLEEWDAMKAF